MASNDRFKITFRQPRDAAERQGVAAKCGTALDISMPLLLDEMDDRVGHAYSGMPDRLYLIDREGRVAYKGGRGPFGFKAGELEQAIVMNLLDVESRAGQAPAAADQQQARVPLLSSEEAWKRLPPAEHGAGQPLPAWARALAHALPRTTAGMLELDYVYRARNPLDPRLAGKMRWVAAAANRCAYTKAYAAADLRRAGVTDA